MHTPEQLRSMEILYELSRLNPPSKVWEDMKWREENRFALRQQFGVVFKLLMHLRQMGLSREYFISRTGFDPERLDLVLRNKAIATDDEIQTINKFCDDVLK